MIHDAKNKHCGTLILNEIVIYQRPTFLDYVRGGLEMNMVLAIDFT